MCNYCYVDIAHCRPRCQGYVIFSIGSISQPVDHLKDNISCIKVQMNSFFLQSTSTFSFSLASYFPFFFIQTENNLFSSSRASNALSVIASSPPLPHPFTALPQHFIEFVLNLFCCCFIPLLFSLLNGYAPLRTSTDGKAWETSTFWILTCLNILSFCSSTLLVPQFPCLHNGRVIRIPPTF